MSNLVNHSVTNLINGVSQQATSVRLDNQLEEQINLTSDVTKGLTIRNGLELENVLAQDISGRFKIEFKIDGQKYLLALDPDDVTPLIHVPLSADIAQLSATITSPDYFKNATENDIKVIEDKDKIYVLNKKKLVGTSTLESTFFDARIVNDRTNKTDTNWSLGSYKFNVTSVADPDIGAVVAETPVDIVVTPSMTIYDIAAAFNATSMVNETGEMSISGNKGSFRLFFDKIPYSFEAPLVVISEVTTIQGLVDGITSEPSSGFLFNLSNKAVSTYDQYLNGSTLQILWDGVEVYNSFLPANTTSVKSGGYTYFLGNIKLLTNQSFEYEIRREISFTTTDEYTPVVSQPVVVTGSEFSADKFSDEAMIWVTGVASNQTYDVTIEYENSAGVAQTPVTLSTVSVGTTTSNIKLNWVADQIRSQINGLTHFTSATTDIYNNAVHFYSTTPYAYKITKLKVDNNFDTTSISSVIKASIDNKAGVVDTSNLPALFSNNFKIRVGNENTTGANYYLKYDGDFGGWKECGLDETRIIDPQTMPFVIDKEKVRKTNQIVIEPTLWTASNAGDEESNPYPSFIEREINDIFFYGSRLGVATDDSIVMSSIGDTKVFFRTTCSSLVTEDRVDIKLDSSKIGYDSIKHVVTYDGKLIVNTGSTQSALLVNTAFDLTSARLSEISSYTLGDHKPLPVESGLYFALSNNNKTNIYNYVTLGNNTYEAYNITKHIPTYIDGNVKAMAYADNLAVIAVEEDKRVLYTQNRFTSGGQLVQNAWHKWELPYDLEHFYFSNNNLYMLFNTEDDSNVKHTFVCRYDLTPQTVDEKTDNAYIGWIPYLDCYTKDKTLIENFSDFIGINDKYGAPFDDVATAYASTLVNQINEGALDGPYLEKSISPIYYWQVDGDLNRIVFNDEAEILLGNTELTQFDLAGFRYFRGDTPDVDGYYEISRSAITDESYYRDDMVYGIKFKATVVLSEVVPRMQGQEGFVVMNYANLMLRRMRLYLGNTGVFNVFVDFKDRKDYTLTYTGQPLGKILLGRSSVSDINFKFPINGKADRVEITISTDSSTPFNLLSAEWQGRLTVKGRNI